MHRPLMTAEQSNVPQNEEELAAATAKRLAAEKVEQEQHEAARKQPAEAPKLDFDDPQVKALINKRNEDVQQGMYNREEADYAIAVASGTMAQHVNAVMFAAALIMAAAKSDADQASMMGYISTEATRIKASRRQPKGQPA